MSIRSEINRIQTNIDNAKTVIATKHVTVPAEATSDDLASLIEKINAVRPGILVVDITMTGATTGIAELGRDAIAAFISGDGVPLGQTILNKTLLMQGSSSGGVVYFYITKYDESVVGSTPYMIDENYVYFIAESMGVLRIDNLGNVSLYGSVSINPA